MSTPVHDDADPPKMGDFTIELVSDDGREWRALLGDRPVATLNREQARAAMLGRYDPAALARGELRESRSCR